MQELIEVCRADADETSKRIQKVQGFIRRYNVRVYVNRVDTMEKRMNENQYSDKLENEGLKRYCRIFVYLLRTIGCLY